MREHLYVQRKLKFYAQHTPKHTNSVCLVHLSLAFLGNIEKHARESGIVMRRIANLIFVGLPGSGKSSLIANLLGILKIKDLMQASPSTNVMNGIITVDISADTSRLHVANVEDECIWSEVEYPCSPLPQTDGSRWLLAHTRVPHCHTSG